MSLLYDAFELVNFHLVLLDGLFHDLELALVPL